MVVSVGQPFVATLGCSGISWSVSHVSPPLIVQPFLTTLGYLVSQLLSPLLVVRRSLSCRPFVTSISWSATFGWSATSSILYVPYFVLCGRGALIKYYYLVSGCIYLIA